VCACSAPAAGCRAGETCVGRATGPRCALEWDRS
jgi:hypothetical protein